MRSVPFLCIALFVWGCASTTDVSQVRQDVTTVYSEQTSYRERTDARISRLERDLRDVQKSVGSPDAGLRKQVVDLSLAADARDDKIKGILGRLDELESQLRTYWEEFRSELRELKKARETAKAPQTVPKITPDELYRQGFDAFQKGAYEGAVEVLGQFVKQYPDATLAPNALFWMGESYMNLKQYEKAVVQFQEIVDRFPKSDKAGRAMLRQAEAFAELGDRKSSATLLKRIVELFPKSEEARVAERRLRGGALQ